MGRFLGGILGITIAAGQPLPNLGFGSANAGWAWSGPKTVYPGHSHYYGFPTTRWRVPVTCSATGNTCNTSGSGYTPTGNETNVYVTATTPPTGMDTMATAVLAPYDICNVSGTQFQLCRHGTATVETFSSTGTAVSILFVPASGLTNGFIVSNTGWPSGTILTWGQTNSGTGWLLDAFTSPNGNPTDNFSNQNSLVLKVDIPTGAAVGDYTINIVDCTTDSTGGMCAGLSDTLTFTVTVTAATPLSDANEATSFPAIPGLSAWVGEMTDATLGGGKWCNKTTGATTPPNQIAAFGIGIDVQFYDGGLNYHRIANYLRDAGWDKCANNILQQVAFGNANTAPQSGVILPNNGAIQGYQVFPIGYEVLTMQDARFIGPIQYLAALMDTPYGGTGGAAFLNQGCNPNDADLRENSYGLDTMLAIDHMGLTPAHDQPGTPAANTWAARRQRCADEIIGILSSYLDGTKRFQENQYFITGIGIDCLIHWWQATKDPRVPIVVKQTLDQYYANYNTTLHKAMWDPEPNGPRCLDAPNWFVSATDGHCRDNTSVNTNDLHNLFSHGFAWYWRISGDDTYRIEGDEVFNHSLDDVANYGFAGKTFSQFFRYSFNYVGWRQGWLSPERSIE